MHGSIKRNQFIKIKNSSGQNDKQDKNRLTHYWSRTIFILLYRNQVKASISKEISEKCTG